MIDQKERATMQIKQDYIMKQIQQLIEVLFGDLLRKKEKTTEYSTVLESEKLTKLLDLVENYEINQAENILFETIDKNRLEDLEVALQFYQKINEKDDTFLAKANYTREEIRQGIQDIAKIYGKEEWTKVF